MLEMCEGPGDGRLGFPHLIRVWIDDVRELYCASLPVVFHAQVRFIAREVRDPHYKDDRHGGSSEKSFGIRRGCDVGDEVSHRPKRCAFEAVETRDCFLPSPSADRIASRTYELADEHGSNVCAQRRASSHV